MIEKIPTTKEIQNFNMKLYSPNHNLVGTIHNELQLLYVRGQIAKENLEGYYITYNDQIYQIRKDGKTDNLPIYGNENSIENMLMTILGF